MKVGTHKNKVKYIVAALSVCLVAAVAVLVAVLAAGCRTREEYLRLHIRANGNSPEEQALKLEVRDAVVAYLTPLAKGVASKAEMQALIRDKMDEVEQIADDVIRQNGQTYRSHAYLSYEHFPTKTYGDLTLPEGDYDAVIIELGEGAGDNWWCVAFPPLCFVAAEDAEGDEVVYRSLVAEWFRKNCK